MTWIEPSTLGWGSSGRKIQASTPASTSTAVPAAANFNFDRGCTGTLVAAVIATALVLPESISRFKRLRSTAISEALWQRNFRSFSNALLTIRSSSSGNSGLRRTGDVGALRNMESKIIAEVFPENAWYPVAISYNTAPNENRSVRASSSSPAACSGDI